jgi:hypothetical protein
MVAYNLEIDCAIASWKDNEIYHKCIRFQYFKVDRVDAMTEQICGSQNPLIPRCKAANPSLQKQAPQL